MCNRSVRCLSPGEFLTGPRTRCRGCPEPALGLRAGREPPSFQRRPNWETHMMFKSSQKSRPSKSRLLEIELLEARDCPSGSYLLVNSYGTDNVLRYDAATGAF